MRSRLVMAALVAVLAFAAAGTAAPEAATLQVRCEGTTHVATVTPASGQTIDDVEFYIEPPLTVLSLDDAAPFEFRISAVDLSYQFERTSGFRFRALVRSGATVETLRSASFSLCGSKGGSKGSALLESKCIGTGIYAKVTAPASAKVSRVVFPAGGRSIVDTRPPYEAWFPPSSFTGVPPGEHRVLAQVYSGPGPPEQLVSTGKRCPAVIRKKPPLLSKIVEGMSIGGVAVGMHWGEVEARWGTPDRKACHGGGASGGSELGGYVCDWDTRGGANGPMTVIFGAIVESVSVHTEGAKRPKYRRWKTSNGIGLGSSVAQLKRAYGGRLHKVPYQKPAFQPSPLVYYVVTSRGSTKWVTTFDVPIPDPSARSLPFQIGRVENIRITSLSRFGSTFRGYAPPGWRP